MSLKLKRGDKKTGLLVYKEKLLQELKYYEQRIDEARLIVNKSTLFEDDASSDSDTGLPQILDLGPSMSQLKSQESMLKTCLQATQELTELELLQHEMNILTEPPKLEGGEPPVGEEGTWQEVTAECRVDLVPFSITFYTFRADRKFAPRLYRGLKVLPLKTAHEAELMWSVLPGLRRPSDAVEVLRSYAEAYRSRRTTLARLADKFAAALHMEPLAGGGYLLKCANLLEVAWTLHNKSSPLASFQHRMKFDVECVMEEQDLKTIRQANRQLSDPSVDTDERTLLLAKIISTCLQVKNLAESGTEGVTDPGEPVKDSEVMAPPKSLPKKGKTKNKENRMSNQKTTKRPAQQENNTDTAKKPKIPDNNTQNDEETRITEKDKNSYKNTNNESVKSAKSNASEKISQKNVAHTKNNSEKKVASVENVVSEKSSQKNAASTKNRVISAVNVVTTKKESVATSKNDEMHVVDKVIENTQKGGKNVDRTNIVNNNVDNVSENVEKNKQKTKNIKVVNSKPKNISADQENSRSVASAKNNEKNVDSTKSSTNVSDKTVKTTKNPVENHEPADKNTAVKDPKEKVVKTVKKVANEQGEVKKIVSQSKVVTKTSTEQNTKNNKELDKNVALNSAKEKCGKSVANAKIIKQTVTNANVDNTVSKTGNIDQSKKPLNEKNAKVTKPTNTGSKQSGALPKPKVSAIATKAKIPGKPEKENEMKNSKIPQKKVITPKLKKMPIRVSPRKPLTKPKLPQVGAGAGAAAGVNTKKVAQKPVTGIPRLLNKPKPKVT